MSGSQAAITVFVIALCTLFTRALPFLLFRDAKRVPEAIKYLGRALPYAIIGMLCVYCVKDVALFSYPYGLPEMISIAAVIGLHLYRRNVLLSIGTGTVLYMLLSQIVFT